MKKFIYAALTFILMIICTSFSSTAATLNVNEDMNADQVLKALNLEPSTYKYEGSYNSLKSTYGSDYRTWDSSIWFECIGIGEGEGPNSNYIYSYFLFRAKIYVVNEDGYKYPVNVGSTYNIWYDNKLFEGNTGYNLSLSTVYDGEGFASTDYCCISDNTTISEGIVIYRYPIFTKTKLNTARKIHIDKMWMETGSKNSDGSYNVAYPVKVNYDVKYNVSVDGSTEGDTTLTNDLPKYDTCFADISRDEITFTFNNFNPSKIWVTGVCLNNAEYALTESWKDTTFGRGAYSTTNFNLDFKGTKNYKINYFVLSNGQHITSDQMFRYTSSKVSVTVEAQAYIIHQKILGIDKTCVGFSLKDKNTNQKINNAKTVQAKYIINDILYSPIKDVKNGNGLFNITNVLSKMGELEKMSSSVQYAFNEQGINTELEYVWAFNYYVNDFDVVYITYESNGELITGSCYENGMHVEYDSNGNPFVYTSDGTLVDDKTANEWGLITDSNGNLIDTENPDAVIIYQQNGWLTNLYNKVMAFFKNDNGGFTFWYYLVITLIVLFIVGILCIIFKPLQAPVVFILRLFWRIITYPIRLLFKVFKL